MNHIFVQPWHCLSFFCMFPSVSMSCACVSAWPTMLPCHALHCHAHTRVLIICLSLVCFLTSLCRAPTFRRCTIDSTQSSRVEHSTHPVERPGSSPGVCNLISLTLHVYSSHLLYTFLIASCRPVICLSACMLPIFQL